MTKQTATKPGRSTEMGKGYAALRALEPPPEMKLPKWRPVEALLNALCYHLPDVHPTQETLAKKMKVDVRTVKRATALARNLGLIETYVTPGRHGHWDSYKYRLKFVDVQPDELFEGLEQRLPDAPIQGPLWFLQDTAPGDTESPPPGDTESYKELPTGEGEVPLLSEEEEGNAAVGSASSESSSSLSEETNESQGGDHLGAVEEVVAFTKRRWREVVAETPELDHDLMGAGFAYRSWLTKTFLGPDAEKPLPVDKVMAIVDGYLSSLGNGYGETELQRTTRSGKPQDVVYPLRWHWHQFKDAPTPSEKAAAEQKAEAMRIRNAKMYKEQEEQWADEQRRREADPVWQAQQERNRERDEIHGLIREARQEIAHFWDELPTDGRLAWKKANPERTAEIGARGRLLNEQILAWEDRLDGLKFEDRRAAKQLAAT